MEINRENNKEVFGANLDKIREFVYSQIPFIDKNKILILTKFYKLLSLDTEQQIPLIVAITPNGAVHMWAAKLVLDD